MIEKLQSYNTLVRIIKYKTDIKKCEQGVAVDKKDVMKEVPSFIKILKEYFWDAKTKGQSSGRVCTKMLMLYDEDLVDLIEMLKEYMSKFKIYLKEQAVSHYLTEITRWYIKLHPEIDMKSIKKFFDEEMKGLIKYKPEYALVNKVIFNGEKAQ